MDQSSYILLVVILIVLLIVLRNQRVVIEKRTTKKRKVEGKTQMIELAKKFIDKECLIYAFDGMHHFEGILREVSNGAILIEKDGKMEAINIDFVIRIREYPKNKKGKKRTFIAD